MNAPPGVTPETLPEDLLRTVEQECSRAVPAAFNLLAENLRQQYGDAVTAVLLYGSCLRHGDATEGIVDLYAIVDDYRRTGAGLILRTLNAWLPPSVHYFEMQGPHGQLRAKIAVISLADFEEGIHRWFHPYLWARFAQGARILYSRDAAILDRMNASLAMAVVRFLAETIPAMSPQETDAESLWAHGLSLTYAAEIRPEPPAKALELAHESRARCAQLTALARPALLDLLESGGSDLFRVAGDRHRRLKAQRRWRLRRWQGRVLSLLRLSRAVFTFRNSIDYAAWKIERHTGVRIEVTPELRRRPLLHGWSVLWRLLRRGALR